VRRSEAKQARAQGTGKQRCRKHERRGKGALRAHSGARAERYTQRHHVRAAARARQRQEGEGGAVVAVWRTRASYSMARSRAQCKPTLKTPENAYVLTSPYYATRPSTNRPGVAVAEWPELHSAVLPSAPASLLSRCLSCQPRLRLSVSRAGSPETGRGCARIEKNSGYVVRSDGRQ